MKAFINGEARELPDGLTVGALLAQIAAPLGGVAVARNERVVRRSTYDSELIGDGDRIEIIKAAAGG